ncbi:PREDICTED: uncharacterized protein LOC108559247 [Nicrophorus vespilloides]|uniref:Uncharacterized protein LOC108559247 n=1 Tax=Nicrophorus vespilloides TaxID=110193 RepID=A0ABM1MBJ7_NICVS|nr:PREDICTED: uncharacterized protein LOC108559247 [Nicrophorus vespilloides]
MSGKGRGRGWLQLNKSQEAKIGSSTLHSPTILASPMNGELSSTMNLQTNPQYDTIIQTLAKFNENDDGIVINQKYKYLTDCMIEECKTQEQVKDCFQYIYDQVLNDETLINKFLMLVTLNSFRDFVVCDVKIRALLLNNMQTSFKDAATLMATNKEVFINAVKLLGGFYDIARMSYNSRYFVLTVPLIKYLEMLLDSGTPEHLELFTILIYKTGMGFIEHDAERKTKYFVTMLIKMRNILLTRTDLEEISRTWLLLSMDLCNNRVLPLDLLKYYQKMLGKATIHNFQMLNAHQNQTTTSNPSGNSNTIKPQQQQQQQQQLTPPKTGRPILGAGARNNKIEENHMRGGEERKENSGSADVKHKSGGGYNWADEKPQQRKSQKNKGWQHDDRFDTEY